MTQNPENKSAVVIGADGFIGKQAFNTFKSIGYETTGTFFASSGMNSDSPLLDLTRPETFQTALDKKAGFYIFCNNLGSIDYCKSHAEQTRHANVKGVINFLLEMQKINAVPVYLSSNMVFDGKKPDYTEDERLNPQTEYGFQKSEVEGFIQNNFTEFLIIRMTKVYDTNPLDRSLFSAWHEAWQKNQKIQAIDDLFIAPLYIADVTKALTVLVDRKATGIFHLSGPVSKSFYEFASDFGSFLNIDSALIEKIAFQKLGFLEERPKYNSLSTQKIRSLLPNFIFSAPSEVFKDFVV